MVLRTSTPVELQSAGTPQLRAPGQAATVRPDFDKFKTGPSTADFIVDAVVQEGSKLAAQAWEVSKEEAYLQGVAAVAAGKTEGELETNPFTAQWETAGFRDTTGRILQAEAEAKLAADMPELATKGQAEFNEYMAQRRAQLTPALEGMSREQRTAAFGTMAIDEYNAQVKYGSARTAHLIDVQKKAINVSLTARREALDTSKHDPEVYRNNVAAYIASVDQDIWKNPNIPNAMKADLTIQAMQFANSSDNPAVHTAFKEAKITFPDGSEGTMMSRIPLEEQIKLDKSYRESKGRVKVHMAAEFETKLASWEASWSDKDAGVTQTYAEVQEFLQVGRETGLIGPGKTETVMTNYFKAVARNSPNSTLAGAYAAGDVQAIFATGKSVDDGLNSWLKANKDKPLPEVVNNLMVMGNNHGFDNALAKAGELMKPAIAQLGYGEDMNPANAQMVHGTIQALEIAEASNPGAYSKFITSMPSEQQDMLLYMREAQAQGIADPLAATQFARNKVIEAKDAGPLRTAQLAKANTDNVALVEEISERQLFSTLSKPARDWFGSSDKEKLRTGRFWFENQDRVDEIMASTKQAYSVELSLLTQANPHLSSESRSTKALARVAARTVPTESGPVLVPRGQTPQQFFGTKQFADPSYIGKALDGLVQPAPGNRIAYSMSPDNQLLYREFNEDGQIVGDQFKLDPKSVGRKVDSMVDQEGAVQAAEVGPGVAMKGSTGAVQANGENTAGQPPRSMLQMRNTLVRLEDVKFEKYPDGTGTSFGVGVSSKGDHFEEPAGPNGTYTQEQVKRSFAAASNDAANYATKQMDRLGLQGDMWFQFFGPLAYQRPASASDPDLLASIQLGDADMAMKALQATAAYKQSGGQRQAYYRETLQQALASEAALRNR